jgi:WD40 repeat protein
MKTICSLLFVLVLSPLIVAADPKRISTDGGFKQHLQWSPDGQRFLLTRIHEGKMAVWTMTVDGKTVARLLPNHTMPHFDACWSADGKRVVYVYDTLQGTDGKLQINSCAADGSDDKVLIPHKAFEESPRLSPDGKQLLWVSTRDGNPDLYMSDHEGKSIQRLTKDLANELHPSWSPNRQAKNFRDECGRLEPHAADRRRFPRCLADGFAGWQADRVRVQSRRQLRYLADELGWQGTRKRDPSSIAK